MSSCQIGSVVFHSSYCHSLGHYCILLVLLKIKSKYLKCKLCCTALHATIHCCCSSHMFDRILLCCSFHASQSHMSKSTLFMWKPTTYTCPPLSFSFSFPPAGHMPHFRFWSGMESKDLSHRCFLETIKTLDNQGYVAVAIRLQLVFYSDSVDIQVWCKTRLHPPGWRK